jgi:hypothetical protein
MKSNIKLTGYKMNRIRSIYEKQKMHTIIWLENFKEDGLRKVGVNGRLII